MANPSLLFLFQVSKGSQHHDDVQHACLYKILTDPLGAAKVMPSNVAWDDKFVVVFHTFRHLRQFFSGIPGLDVTFARHNDNNPHQNKSNYS